MSGEHTHPETGTLAARVDDLEARVLSLEGTSHEHTEPEPEPAPEQSADWESLLTGVHKRPIDPSWRRVQAIELDAYADGTEVYPGFPDANKLAGWGGSGPEECFFLDARVDPVSVDVYAPKQWNDRCGGSDFEGTIQMPANWRDGMSSAEPGSTPNNQTTVLQPDGVTFYCIKSADPCGPTTAAGWLTGPWEVTDDLAVVSARGASEFGPATEIRAADMVGPIEHMVSILPSAHMLYGATPANGGQNDTGHPGFVYPASDQDGNYNSDHSNSTYKGGTPELTMGSVLTLKAGFDHSLYSHLSPLFQKLLRAFENYGAIIGDISAWSKQFTYLSVEAAAVDAFRAEWGEAEQTNFVEVIRDMEVVVIPEAEPAP